MHKHEKVARTTSSICSGEVEELPAAGFLCDGTLVGQLIDRGSALLLGLDVGVLEEVVVAWL